MAALALITKMKAHSTRINIIAREMALDIAHATYTPNTASHIAGVANVAADALSRIDSPGSDVMGGDFLSYSRTTHISPM